jgi:hypothetical protein
VDSARATTARDVRTTAWDVRRLARDRAHGARCARVDGDARARTVVAVRIVDACTVNIVRSCACSTAAAAVARAVV